MNDHTRIGYAVVGLGVGRTHADAAAHAQNAELVAVCDLKEELLDGVKAQYPQVLTYRDYDEMLKNPEIDIVSVAVPTGMHTDFTIRALAAGKHVLCEKPLDVTAEKAAAIEEARLKYGKKVGCIYQNRFNLPMRPLRQAISEGRLGKLVLGTFAVKWYRSQSYYDSGGWRGTWEMDGGGSLMNQAIHTVDLMQWLMGDVESVTAQMGIYGHSIATEDMTASLIRFRSGAVATFVSTTCAYPGISTDIQLYGTEGSVEIDGDRLKTWKLSDGKDDEEEMLELYGGGNATGIRADPKFRYGHEYQVEDMIDAVLSDRDPLIPPAEAMKALRIVNAVYDSAKSGRAVIF